MQKKDVQKLLETKSPVKIFVSYHKKFLRPASAMFIPIHIGRAIVQKPTKDDTINTKEHYWLMNNLIGDDTGDNISEENRKYCELTAQYWVWKHLNQIKDTQYIGFMHYRRQFLFNKFINILGRSTWYTKSCVYKVETFKNLTSFLNLKNESDIYQNIIDYDCLLLKPYNVENIGYKSIKTRFCHDDKINIERFEIFEKIIKELFPEYSREINDVLYGKEHILCNMFIMKKELFEEYAQFLFKILKECDKQFYYTKSDDPEEMRTLSLLGEFISTIFIHIKEKEIKIKYVNGLIYGESKRKQIFRLIRLINLMIKRSI